MSKPGIAGLLINDEDKNGFMSAVHGLDKTKGLDLLLHTPGGLVLAALQIARAIHKHQGKVCGGVELHVTDRSRFEPYRTGLWCVKVARDFSPRSFGWRRETYEFVSDRLAIDLLAGTDRYRQLVESDGNVDDWVAEWDAPLREFAKVREEFLLYRDET